MSERVDPIHAANCERVARLFEGREAIYVEKGVARVRVFNIHADPAERVVSAEVEVLPTPGLDCTPGFRWRRNEPAQQRWEIGAGFTSTFSDESWAVSYGMWSLYFAPSLIDDVTRFAAQLPDDVSLEHRYHEILQHLFECDGIAIHASEVRVFPGAGE